MLWQCALSIDETHSFFVLQALTVLEFLVANGAERIIDDFSEHAYQVQVCARSVCSLFMRMFKSIVTLAHISGARVGYVVCAPDRILPEC